MKDKDWYLSKIYSTVVRSLMFVGSKRKLKEDLATISELEEISNEVRNSLTTISD